MKNNILLFIAMCTLPFMGYAQIDGVSDSSDEAYFDIESVEPIEPSLLSVHSYNYEEYQIQSKVWERQTKLRPHDANAWRNYFLHTSYMISLDYYEHPNWESYRDSVLMPIIVDMEKAIPDTYEYYACASVVYRSANDDGHNEYFEKAMKKEPAIKNLRYYDSWFGYLHLLEDKARYEPFGKEYIASGIYSQELLKYTMNELDGMAKNAIFIGNGDASVIPKWLIADGLGKHRDKLIICYSYLGVPYYCKQIFKALGIGEVPEHEGDFKDVDEYDEYINSIIKLLVERTGRELYFSKYNSFEINSKWEDHLYDEGLILHYSPTKIDEMAMKKYNFENVYDLSYLLNPMEKDPWDSDVSMSLSVLRNLGDLLAYYKAHDNEHYNELYSLLKHAIERTKGYTGDRNREYLDYHYSILDGNVDYGL